MAFHLNLVTLLVQSFVHANIEENTQVVRFKPLWGKSIGNLWIPLTKGQ